MKCPYNGSRLEQIVQTTNEYNEVGQVSFTQQKLIETRQQAECTKEECGAWLNGHCGYYADIAGK